jgi:hypothetical protein
VQREWMTDELRVEMYWDRESNLEKMVHIVSLALMELNHLQGLPCEKVQKRCDLDQYDEIEGMYCQVVVGSIGERFHRRGCRLGLVVLGELVSCFQVEGGEILIFRLDEVDELVLMAE